MGPALICTSSGSYWASARLLTIFTLSLDFLVVNVRALAANRLAGARRHEEHVALAQQYIRPVLIQHDAAVHLAGDAEGDSARHVALDQSRHHIRLRPLRRQYQVNPHRPRLLRQANDERFHFLSAGHHQISQLVDDDDDVRQLLGNLRLFLREWRA